MDCIYCVYQFADKKETCAMYEHAKPMAVMNGKADCNKYRELRVLYQGIKWYAIPAKAVNKIDLVDAETGRTITISQKKFLSAEVRVVIDRGTR